MLALGFPGERWDDDLDSLIVPTGYGDDVIVVLNGPGEWIVLTMHDDIVCDSLLMAAAIVTEIITLVSNFHAAQT